MNHQELYEIHRVCNTASELLWQAWKLMIDHKEDISLNVVGSAKAKVQQLHGMLFPEQYENVVSEVAARQAEIRDVKHEMD